MHVRIDSREQDRIDSAKTYFEKHGHTVTIEELPVGDYVFDDYLYVEYKRIDDFYSSLDDNRLNNQSLRMYNECPVGMVVIEENKKILDSLKKYWTQQDIISNDNRYNSTIASLNRYCTVVIKQTEHQCFRTMMIHAEKFLSDKTLFYKPEVKTANPATNFLSMISGIGPKTAVLISREFDLYSLTDLLGLNLEDLLTIKGVGNKTAENVLKAIGVDD